MKRRNMSKSIAQKGGLMIEALAMLGLIAVVTPTMYKKSAERTMEVEDINTASTIRTVMNAANDYVGANYSTIVSEMEHSTGNASNYRKITFDQIKNYLPYGFNMKKALYNYGDPEISIARKDNNLTAFVLFPAKANADNGIGQERTSRIASLVGSSGGFVTEKGKTARGIGGVWKLEETDYKGVFPDKAENAEEHSIVTASADTINSAVNNEVDMDKYLQRGRDAGDTDSSSLWKNTMRTDLYMGNTDITNDVYNDEDKYKDKTFSIRNVKSMIIGAEYAGGDKDLDEASNYGLYVTGNKPDTYLLGTLEAVDSDFRVLQNQLSFGRTAGADGNKGDYAFTIDNNGDTETRGQLIVDRNVYLANKLPAINAGEISWDTIEIGNLGGNAHIISATPGQQNGGGSFAGQLTLINQDIAQIKGYSYGSHFGEDDQIVLLNDGYNKLPQGATTAGGGGGVHNGTELPEIEYQEKPTFPVRIGSNALVDGLLTARQIDTQKLRLATLSAGSHNIDDNEKWLNVDQYGITMADIHHENNGDYDPSGTYASFNQNGILFRADEESHAVSDDDRGGGADYKDGGKDTSEHMMQLNLRRSKTFAGDKAINNVAEMFADYTDVRAKETAKISGNSAIIQASNMTDWKEDYNIGSKEETKDFRDEPRGNTVLLRNQTMQMHMEDSDLIISGRTVSTDDLTLKDPNGDDTLVSTIFNGGTVDVKNANLNVYKDASNYGPWQSASSQQVFSVRTNDEPDTGSPKNTYADNYDITMHGKVLITNEAGGKVAAGATDADTTNKAHKLISIGGDTIQTDAGINIIQRSDDAQISNAYKNILIIEQGATDEVNKNSNNNNSNNNGINTDNGTIYIRKGFVEIHGEREESVSSGNTDKSADQGLGVIKASRFVANNPDITEASMTGQPHSSGKYGARVPMILQTISPNNEWEKYNNTSTANRYDTYMVNPAYTSVMHDIKLTTRGGARLSDVLPDFINKGIYVVNNTVKENQLEKLNLSTQTYEYLYGIADADINKLSSGDKLDLATESAWASPFLGVVPAPQCPPGYGRVITLTPASFQVGQAGKLMKRNEKVAPANSYYVVPNNASSDQIAASVNDSQVAYELVGVTGKATDKNNQEVTIDPNKVTTAKYVLTQTANSDQHPVVPLTFQQSTWLKSMVKPLYQKPSSEADDKNPKYVNPSYVRGWATMMGFLYPTSLYSGFTPQTRLKATDEAYWNLFPVIRGSLEGYATVYCYFDRTNMFKGYNYDYENFVDNYNYLQTMDKVPTSYKKESGNSNYQKRLNDPSLKYDEVW